jgi:hypothetical protein
VEVRYFYAKIHEHNSLAGPYLGGEGEMRKPAIPIWFNCEPDDKAEFLDRGGAREQGRNFFWCGENNDHAYIVVIYEGKLFLAKPIGDVEFRHSRLRENVEGFVKLLPIKKVKEMPLVEAPSVLASMTANTYYNTGTFREISDPGNIKALETVLFGKITKPEENNPEEILNCLGSVGFETLIAKLFEEQGCFVPAYRGGATQGIDIIAFNDSKNEIRVGHIEVPPGSAISIQVKRRTSLEKPPPGCDYLISVNRDSEWIIDVVNDTTHTKRWLERSLDWLPEDYLRMNGLS